MSGREDDHRCVLNFGKIVRHVRQITAHPHAVDLPVRPPRHRQDHLGFWLPAWKLKAATKQVRQSKFYFFDAGVARALNGEVLR